MQDDSRAVYFPSPVASFILLLTELYDFYQVPALLAFPFLARRAFFNLFLGTALTLKEEISFKWERSIYIYISYL